MGVRRGREVVLTITYCRVEHNRFTNAPLVILKGSDNGAGWGWYCAYDPRGRMHSNHGTYAGPYSIDVNFLQEMIDHFYQKPVNEISVNTEDF